MPPSAPAGPAPATLRYDATTACIDGHRYANDVMPSNAGEFDTHGLDLSYWGGTHAKTAVPLYSQAPWTGFQTQHGRFNYGADVYWSDPSDGLKLPFPLAIANDTAVPGSPRALRIAVRPLPEPQRYSPQVYGDNHVKVAHLTSPVTVPPDGGTVALHVDTPSPSGVRDGDRLGFGYYTWKNLVAAPGTKEIFNGTVGGIGTAVWTLTDVHLYSGRAGDTIPADLAEADAVRKIAAYDYYSGTLATNVDRQYGFFVARLRMPPYLPGVWPAFWMVGTAGYPRNSYGVMGNEIDVQEMFGERDRGMSQGEIQYRTGPAGSMTYAPPSGYGGALYDWYLPGDPVSDYHDYGALLTPEGVTFYVDGIPTRKHAGLPDWTAGSPDKEILLQFQMGLPGSWLDRNSRGLSNPYPLYYWAQWLRIYAPTGASC